MSLRKDSPRSDCGTPPVRAAAVPRHSSIEAAAGTTTASCTWWSASQGWDPVPISVVPCQVPASVGSGASGKANAAERPAPRCAAPTQ